VGRRRRGQIVIIATLVIAILILSIAAMLYETATTYQRIRREYVSGLLDNISREFDKVLMYILMSATQRYNLTAEIDTPRAYAYLKFSYWTKSLIRELSEYGAQVNITYPRIFLQPARVLYDMEIEERYVYDLIKMYWYATQGLSVISASVTVNIPGLGFYGWNKTSLILLNATALLDKIRVETIGTESYTAVDIIVNKENNIPIERLSKSSFKVMYFEPDYNEWRVANIERVRNNGGGNYTLLLSRDIPEGGPIPSGLEKYLIIWVMDNRGIIVELYTYDHIDYIVEERAIQQFYPTSDKSYEIYTFEIIQNGTWLWLNKPLEMNSTRPIPIPPVKQLRVYATRHGVNDTTMVEVPSQVEVWTSDYRRPTLQFADWRRRFSLGDKLVFIVGFNETGVDKQRVRIKWFHDADTPPPEYLIHFSVNPPFVYVDNGVYILQLVAEPGYSDWIDWSISVHWNGYHIEYMLYGYDVYPMDGGYWFPMKLPGGNWTLLVGPIRAIAFRENNLVVVPPTEGEIYDELYHVELIEIPYGVHYFLYFGYFKWLKDVTLDYRYLTLFGQISGTRYDTDSALRVRYGSIQLETLDDYITGNYTIYGMWPWNCMHRDRRINDAGNFGYWAAQYTMTHGQIMFIDEETYNLLKSPEYSDYSQVWAWSTYDYARRVLSYDLLYWDSRARNFLIPAGTEMNLFFAGLVYDGGNAYSPFKNDAIWNDCGVEYIYAFDYSDGANVPQQYYRMFLEEYSPVIKVLPT